MLSLTTAQRDLLHFLLATDAPIGAAVLGERLHLTVRQVHYGLRAISDWLARRHTTLRNTPGVGVQVICTPEQRQQIIVELASQPKFQLILTPEQRQQLLAISLLVNTTPFILQQFQQDLAVARATVLKDLDVVELWLRTFELQIERRQHRGFWIEGSELAKRQALAAMIWGDVPFGRPIMEVQQDHTIDFALNQDAELLPIIGQVSELVRGWNLTTAQACIIQAEADLGARFSDEAVVPLALAIALQNQRVHTGQHISWDAETFQWIESQVVWPVAAQIGADLWSEQPEHVRAMETAALALQLMCSARDEPWRNNVDADPMTRSLTNTLLRHTANAYGVPELAHDELLRDGLEALVMPACTRQRFHLWTPPRDATDTETERYEVERSVAAQLDKRIVSITGMALPPDAFDDLILLLRASIIRTRTERPQHVLVVCPSGMATTQLLVARLRARFPRMGIFEVLPMRELTAARIAHADLIITTVPLTLANTTPITVIHVHPMLKPEDIANLIQWMA